MNRELLLLVDALAREKNVPKEIVFVALESALASAMRPFKRRAPSVISRRFTWASSPVKRPKSASFRSGRSSPGELTSRRS